MPAPALSMMITNAGLDALVDAAAGTTAAITVTEVGLTATAFIAAPTLVALPGEARRIDTLSGLPVSPSMIHMTATDPSADVYTVTGFGLYLADGTLFAVYSQADPIFVKASVATFLISLDIAFADSVASAISFGDALFAYPPATETTQGIARRATTAKVTAGLDDEAFVTALKLAQRLLTLSTAIGADLAALNTALTAAIAAVAAKTVTGSGLITGGGAISTNPVVALLGASVAEMRAATITDKALTPGSFAGSFSDIGGTLVYRAPDGLIIQIGQKTGSFSEGSISHTHALSFPTVAYPPVIAPLGNGSSGNDIWAQLVSFSTSGFTAYAQQPAGSSGNVLPGLTFIAAGR